MLLSLGLLTGCGGGEGKGAGAPSRPTPDASASATRQSGPAYKGAALPELARTPVWSVRARHNLGCAGDPAEQAAAHVLAGDDVQACVVGDAVVLTEDLTKADDMNQAIGQHYRVRLYDAHTGRVRRTVDTDLPDGWPSERPARASAYVQTTQWKDGSPALLVIDGDEVPADGLKKATVRTTYTMYAPSGAVLGRSSFTGDAYTDLTAEAGHLLMREGPGTSTYTPIGGGADVQVHDRGDDQDPLGSGFGYYVHSSYDAWDGSGSKLVVSDRRTGKEMWTLDDVGRPAALAKDDDATPVLHPLTADKGLLVWDLPAGAAHGALLTVVDLRTGRLLAEGPQLDTGNVDRLQSVLSADGSTAVTRMGAGAVAWNVTTGKELWRQEEGEQDITPLALPTTKTLYADAGDDLGLAAVDMATKKVVGKNLVSDVYGVGSSSALQFTPDGYGVLADGDFFVFAPQKG
ncbi:PQQ-binding-like beta-propeller repeat protein [Streptomyces filipinensis]|uniref:outer membrane protein assembly factor BamB family protein n=1 Tax=Streptomyces filipinensis TaxID=66887 RepID=UPI0036E39303